MTLEKSLIAIRQYLIDVAIHAGAKLAAMNREVNVASASQISYGTNKYFLKPHVMLINREGWVLEWQGRNEYSIVFQMST